MNRDQPGAGPHRLSAQTLLLYSLPGLPLAALTLPLYVVVPNFYATDLGLSLSAVGLVLFALRVFDGVIDPALGHLCDRFGFRFGRRRSWMVMAMPISVLSAYMLFVPPAGADLLHLIIWGFAFSISFSALSLSYTAWGAELATGYDERNRVAAYREVATLIGTVVATATPAIIISLSLGGNAFSLFVIAVFVAIATPLTCLTTLWKVPEPVDRSVRQATLKEGLIALWQNKPFLRLVSAFIFNGLSNALPATLFLYFVTDRLDAENLRGALLLLYFFFGMISVPLWVKVAGRYGKHRSWCMAMLLNCLFFAGAPLLGPGDVVYFAVICVLTGSMLGADVVIPSSIQADVIDVDTVATGEQRSGLYFSVWSVATQISLAAAVGLAFPILEYTGFDATQSGNMTADAPGLFTLAILYGWVPIAMKLIAISLMWSFPINRAMQEDLERQIEARQ